MLKNETRGNWLLESRNLNSNKPLQKYLGKGIPQTKPLIIMLF